MSGRLAVPSPYVAIIHILGRDASDCWMGASSRPAPSARLHQRDGIERKVPPYLRQESHCLALAISLVPATKKPLKFGCQPRRFFAADTRTPSNSQPFGSIERWYRRCQQTRNAAPVSWCQRIITSRLDFVSKRSVRMRNLVRFAAATMLLASTATMASAQTVSAQNSGQNDSVDYAPRVHTRRWHPAPRHAVHARGVGPPPN